MPRRVASRLALGLAAFATGIGTAEVQDSVREFRVANERDRIHISASIWGGLMPCNK